MSIAFGSQIWSRITEMGFKERKRNLSGSGISIVDDECEESKLCPLAIQSHPHWHMSAEQAGHVTEGFIPDSWKQCE